MKKSFAFLVVFVTAIIMPVLLLAQDVTSTLPDADVIQSLMGALTSKGVQGMALVALVIQMVMQLLRSQSVVNKIGDLKGHLRITILLFLSLLGGMATLMAQGMDWKAALMHSTTLAAFQVLANQIFKQYVVKQD